MPSQHSGDGSPPLSSEEVKLRTNHVFLLDEIDDPRNIARILYQNMVISGDNLERINLPMLTERDRTEALVRMILAGREKAYTYNSFLEVLRQTSHDHVADKLESTDFKGRYIEYFL